jgi:hypothetical protein
MDELENRKRKYYPGDVRQVGTKEYSMILGNLINYKHQLVPEADEQKVGDLMLKVSLKLKELGYESEYKSIKKKLGRRKNGRYQEITSKKKNDTINTAIKVWEEANQNNEEAKVKNKRKA